MLARMVEIFGMILAGLVAGLCWLGWRVAMALRRLLPGPRLLRTAPLRLARRRLRHADDRAAALIAENRRLRLALRAARLPLAQPPLSEAPREARFAAAKRAFALRFHPDRINVRATERAIRIAMFKEHWAELRRIERQ